MDTRICQAAALEALLPRWHRLEARCTSVPLSARMLDGPLPHAGASIVTAWEHGRLIGLWPLRVTRRGPLRIATRLGRELQPYDGMLIAPEADSHATAAALWTAAQRCPADVLRLRAVHDGTPLSALPAISAVATPATETWWLDTGSLSDPEAVITRLSKSRRKTHRRNLRALEKRGALAFRHLSTPTERAHAAQAALSLKRGWLEAQDLHSFALSAPWFERGFVAAAEQGAMEVFALELDGEGIAYELGFRDPHSYRSFLGAYDPAWSSLGVGAALTAAVLQWCVRSGVSRCDLLPPSTSFKSGWCDHSAVVRSALVPLSRRGRLYGPAADAARQLKPVYLGLSPSVRGRLNSLLRGLGTPLRQTIPKTSM